MESSNKKVITLTVFIILGMIIVPTIYKVYKTHENRLLLVVKKEFEYQATKCYREEKCPNNKVTLKELYDLGYLKERLVEPSTKKYYNEESYFDVNTKEINLVS